MNKNDIEHMAQGFPPSHIGKDHEEVVIELAGHVLSLQQKLDGANAELARYSMPAGQADQYAAEAKTVRKVLGFAENAEDVAPIDLLEKIAGLRAEGIYFAANRMLAAWDSGFIDDTPAQVYDISGAVLSAVEFLPGASPEDFKRDFADSIRTEIAAKSRAETDTTSSQHESLAGGK